MRRIVLLGHGRDAGIEGHRGVEGFEHRTQLVRAQGDLVEDPLLGLGRRQLGIGRAGVVGIEIGQREHPDNLAGAHIHDDAGGTFGAEIADDLGQLLVEDELHAGVERQLDRPGITLDPGVERPFDAGEPVIVDPAKPDDMGGQVSERVDPALLMLELQTRDAEAIDLELLARGQAALDPDKALA